MDVKPFIQTPENTITKITRLFITNIFHYNNKCFCLSRCYFSLSLLDRSVSIEATVIIILLNYAQVNYYSRVNFIQILSGVSDKYMFFEEASLQLPYISAV